MAMAKLKARSAGATLTLDIHETARVGTGVLLVVAHGSSNHVRIGAGSRIEDGVLLHLSGGTVSLGPRTELRRNTVLHVNGGHLELQADNILSWGCTVHCAERVVLEAFAGASEYVTITDSRHFHTDEETFFYHNAESAPVLIGRNTWLASKATVLMGTEIGAHAVVGCHSVASGQVPAAMLVAGAPARPIRSSFEHDRRREGLALAGTVEVRPA